MKKSVLAAFLSIISHLCIAQPPPWAQFKDGKFHYYCWKDSADVTFEGFNGYTADNFFLNIDSTKVEKYEGKRSFGLFTNWIDSRYDGKKWALVEADCKQLTPYIYDFLFPLKPYNSKTDIQFDPILFLACKEGKWGAVNCKGKELIPCVYDLPFAKTKEGECIFSFPENLNCDLSKKLSCKERMVENGVFSYSMFGNNLVFIKNGKFGVVDTLGGKIVLAFDNDNIVCKKNSFYEIKKGKKDLKYSSVGVLLPYDTIFESENRYHRVLKNNKYGMIDESGNIFVPCIYERLSDLKFDTYFEDYTGEAELKGKEFEVKINKAGEITFTEE